MDLPIPRHRDRRPTPDDEFERLRRSLSSDLERWPHFADDVIRTVLDVVPLAEVEETDESYVLAVELPGVRRDDVSVEVLDHRLVVTAERRERRRGGLLRHRMRTSGRFRLAAALPPHIDGDAVTASLDHGVLTVTVPKTGRDRRRRIPIGFPPHP
jgi:HSP20 family protein